MHRTLDLWTVYASPSDFPGKYVARRFEVSENGERGTADHIVSDTLNDLRMSLVRDKGLSFRMGAVPGDDPVIVETWI